MTSAPRLPEWNSELQSGVECGTVKQKSGSDLTLGCPLMSVDIRLILAFELRESRVLANELARSAK